MPDNDQIMIVVKLTEAEREDLCGFLLVAHKQYHKRAIAAGRAHKAVATEYAQLGDRAMSLYIKLDSLVETEDNARQ